MATIADHGVRDEVYVEGRMEMFENTSKYRKGGYHPVELGSRFDRYKVLQKLGSTDRGLMWLCMNIETRAYISLFILQADDKDSIELKYLKKRVEGIASPIDHFKIDGPNGSHEVLVFAPMAAAMNNGLIRNGKQLRNAGLQVTKGLAALHADEICHGHVAPYAVLTELESMNGLSESKVGAQFGQPVTARMLRRADEQPHDLKEVPQNVVSPFKWSLLKKGPMTLSDKHCLDLNSAYKTSEPPKKLTMRPQFSSPEYLLEGTAGTGTDIWALGCTIYKLRTGFDLFDPTDERDESLFSFCCILGKLPEKWWNKWEHRDWHFKNDSLDLMEGMEYAKDEPSSIREAVNRGIYVNEENEIGCEPEDMTEEEKKLLIDLLESIFKWKPEDRPSAAKIAEHAWFKT